MKAASIVIGIAAGLLLVYEIVALANPDAWTISRWIWVNTEGTRGASWLGLLGFLCGHFVMRRRPWTDRYGIIVAVVLTYIGSEVVGGLTDIPTLAKLVYIYAAPGGEASLSIPFLFGYFFGGIAWTRSLSVNE
jgi:hypothetical protein